MLRLGPLEDTLRGAASGLRHELDHPVLALYQGIFGQ